MAGRSARSSRTADIRFMSRLCCQTLSPVATAPPGSWSEPPTTCTMMSTSPSCSPAAAATASTPSGVLTSARTNRTPVGSVAGAERAVVRTVAPAPASRAVIAAPMPLLPPVTTAVRPASSPFVAVVILVLLVRCGWGAGCAPGVVSRADGQCGDPVAGEAEVVVQHDRAAREVAGDLDPQRRRSGRRGGGRRGGGRGGRWGGRRGGGPAVCAEHAVREGVLAGQLTEPGADGHPAEVVLALVVYQGVVGEAV